jgi:hypothetical protein
LTVFPKGKRDDQVDATARVLDWLKRAGREPGDLSVLSRIPRMVPYFAV